MDNLIKALTHREPLPPLLPKKVWDQNITTKIEKLSAAPLIKAGLHLLNDDFLNCHIIAQENENPDGNYWHAILHRREPDYWNSKYWYKRVGDHPVIHDMQKEEPSWDPFNFVDQCEKFNTTQERQIQLQEITLLLNYTIKKYAKN
ncbi:MAG: hypothetical protein QGH91_06180 [Candidatus Marinimicrobia bacterium]|nr:hypothetical protein [Candidatus Neomarinimicrobiota bacterium]HJL74558.1 hypothetical protein [Candidatus Neomarinimicrobiota bacterium]